jgi:predicted metalloprotease
MKLHTGAGVVILGLLALTLNGCSSTGGGEVLTCPDGYTLIGSTCFEDPVIGTEASEISPTAICTVPAATDFEGYFDESGMRDYLDCIVPMVDAWINTVYSSMAHPNSYIYIPEGVVVTHGCVDSTGASTADDTAMFYCSGDGNVYLGQAVTWMYYSEDGDASIALAIAHEVTHHFQAETEVYGYLRSLEGGELTSANTILAENQADCGAGAFLNYLNREGLVNDDDIGDLSSILADIAVGENDPNRDHGTLEERVASFNFGFQSAQDQPMFDCNQIIAASPLITN